METKRVPTVLQPKYQQAAMAGQLGPALDRYGASMGEISKSIGLGLTGLIMGTGMAGIVVVLFLVNGIDGTAVGTGLFLGALGLIFLAGGFITSSEAIRSIGQEVYLFQQGFLLVRWGQISVYPWAQIQTIRQHITRHYKRTTFGEKYTGTTCEYTIKHTDGKKLELNNHVRDIEKLGEAVTRGFSTFSFPLALASLKAGDTLTFGGWSINLQGIRNAKESLSWQDVQGYQVVEGRIHILRAKGAGYWDNRAVRHIDNIFIFTALVDALLQRTRSS